MSRSPFCFLPDLKFSGACYPQEHKHGQKTTLDR